MKEPFEYLKSAFDRGRLSHAYILEGDPFGAAGELAKRMSELLVCTGPEPKPCGQCNACRRVRHKAHPDIKWIEPGGAMRVISVGMIEEVMKEYRLTAFEGGWRASIIVCSERFTEQAANKFLKTLEEPPDKALFLLITQDPDANLATIRSRCQNYKIAEPPFDISRLGDWGRMVLSILKNGFPVTDEEVLATTAMFAQVFDEAKKDITKRITKELNGGEEDLEKTVIDARASSEARGLWRDLLRLIQFWYRDIMVLQSGGDESLLFHKGEVESLRQEVVRPVVTPGRVRRVTMALDDAAAKMANNLPPLTAFESCLSRLT